MKGVSAHFRTIGRRCPAPDVHVYRSSKLVVKWDLENWQPMQGKASRRIHQLIKELVNEGEL